MLPLETATFEQFWTVGRTTPLEEAIAEALAIADEIGTETAL